MARKKNGKPRGVLASMTYKCHCGQTFSTYGVYSVHNLKCGEKPKS